MMLSPGHPGGVLSEELETLGISISKASEDLGISRQILSAILNERRPITSDMAVRIGHYIGNGAGIWARMQTNYDLAQAEKKMRPALKKIPRAIASA
jgi:addiction module HigA family antidote